MPDFIIEFFCEIADFFINLQADKITEKAQEEKLRDFSIKGKKANDDL